MLLNTAHSMEIVKLFIHYLRWPIIWLIVITLLHNYLNFESSDRVVIRMGYMPVITNFSAPILDHASVDGEGVRFKAIKFSSFAEMAEAIRNNQIDVAFIIAPLSIVLHQQNVPVNIVMIGNRQESTFVTRADLNIKEFSQLEGKTIAVPMRFSGHNLGVLSLIKEHGLDGKIKVVEMNPPDMASALAAGALDAYFVGEPFAAKTLQSGDSNLLFHVESIWPEFICNLVVVNEQLIKEHPKRVEQFVESAARAGKWISNNKQEAATIASKYWNSEAGLIQYAMNTPENRIVYDQFIPEESQLQKMADTMLEYGLVKSSNINGLVNDKFAKSVNLDGVEDITSIIAE
ncbi:MAG: ABC transporter substrate-binding protein [Candidatus Polarisedimenticolaceae bacterium]|nr:ABC transporter substrate-binding protein [Candidatus Polarisedimenticolaceae bacterium]